MKRITAAAAATAVAAQCLLQGCVSVYGSTEKLRDLEFQVVSEEDAPEELRSAIDEAQEKPYQIIYAEQDTLWIAEGYGKKTHQGTASGYGSCMRQRTPCMSAPASSGREKGRRSWKPLHIPV